MTVLSNDTHPEIEARLLAGWRQMPPHAKLDQVCQMRDAVISLAMAGLQARHPDEDARELRRRLATLLVGEELAAPAYGPREKS